MPALSSWLTTRLWDQFVVLLPPRPAVDPTHPLGCHCGQILDRIVFDKLIQVLRFGCSYKSIADTIITIRSLIRKAWPLYRWDTRPARRP